jgi:hypothetical protein
LTVEMEIVKLSCNLTDEKSCQNIRSVTAYLTLDKFR